MSVQELQKIISPKFTEEVVHEIITKKSGLSEIQVKKITIGGASKKGDSYLSTICRFTLEATGKNKKHEDEFVSIPIIVKFLPKNIARQKTYRSAEFFENEVIFYEKVWEPLRKFQEEAQIEEKFDAIPILLSSCIDGTNDFVVLYDFSSEAYRSAERGSGLDYEHTVAILQVLAQFHGLSLTFKEKQPENFEKAATSLKETYFSEKHRPWYERFQQNVFKVIRDAVEKELPAEYLHKLNKLIDGDLFELLVRSCVVRGPLSVVTHGDVWVPNFLIQYDGPKPNKIIVIDFQLARYTTLVTDLVFFLYSCVDMSLIEHKWDDLVEQYHKALTASLKRYKCNKSVTLEELHKEIKEHSIMGVGMSMEALIMCQLEDDDVSDLDGIQGDQAVPLESVWLIHPFKEQEKRKRIASMIKFAADKNFI